MKDIILLGASGSIGKQTIDIIKKDLSSFNLIGVSVFNNFLYLKQLLHEFSTIRYAFLKDDNIKNQLKIEYPNVNFYSLEDGFNNFIDHLKGDILVNALMGFSGLYPSIFAIKNNMILALANKESLVVGGEYINQLLKESKSKIYPIDSEHSAIYKCLKQKNDNVKKIILTASGGAFRNLSRDQLKDVTKKDALNHPTWSMGKRITLDSDTMMNKCFEIIEAHYLFKMSYDKIGVILHDESMIHSMVEYLDNTYLAEINKPDMHNPIAYALYESNYPCDLYKNSDYHKFGNYHFHLLDEERFPLIKLAKDVIENKGIYGCVLNACDEECCFAFLNDEISFLQIEEIIFTVMSKIKNDEFILNYDLYEKYDYQARQLTRKIIKQIGVK